MERSTFLFNKKQLKKGFGMLAFALICLNLFVWGCALCTLLFVLQLACYFLPGVQRMKVLHGKIIYYVFYLICCHVIFFFDWISGTKLTVYGTIGDLEKIAETSYRKESFPRIFIPNHLFSVDMLAGWILSERFASLGSLKFAMKSITKHVPVFGWCFNLTQTLFLRRNWCEDEKFVDGWIDKLALLPYNPTIAFLPEGTRFTVEKQEKSVDFVKKSNLSSAYRYQYHLLPRIKGFNAIMQSWANNSAIPADKIEIFDTTIATNLYSDDGDDEGIVVDPYKHDDIDLFTLISQRISHFHIFVRYFNAADNEEVIKNKHWLYDLFVGKDEVMKYFYRHKNTLPAGDVTSLFQHQVPSGSSFQNGDIVVKKQLPPRVQPLICVMSLMGLLWFCIYKQFLQGASELQSLYYITTVVLVIGALFTFLSMALTKAKPASDTCTKLH